MRRTRTPALAAVLLAAATLAGCGGEDTATSMPPPGSTTATNTQTGLGFDVSPCLSQAVGGTTVAGLVVPDTVKINLAAPSGFPNGRRLPDPVIDVTLAVLFLDLTRHPATTLAGVPVNPAANDLPFLATFPYLAAAQGTPPLPAPGGANFDFRTDPASAYVRVDRMGMPAVATAIISSSQKNPYNDDSPAIDATGKHVPDILITLAGLTRALADDFDRLGLAKCARAF